MTKYLVKIITLTQIGIQPIVNRVGLFGLVQGTCLFVLNIYENVNVNSFMQNINVKVLYLNNKHNFQITLARKKLLGKLKLLVLHLKNTLCNK